MINQVRQKVNLTLPILENMELAAAQTALCLAKMMDFEENSIDEIQLALIEICINAFEHSRSKDKQVFITFLMRDDALEMKVSDSGMGFQPNQANSSKGSRHGRVRKRGWGLEIIRNLMDSVTIQSSEKGTTVTIIKQKTPSVK